ncbi:hypothetical protein AGMMS50239_32300 [Bacteroidia bacterium]|nr:hypothetical protein AGMMS50239_32300 [Bacteroidia bacterium]
MNNLFRFLFCATLLLPVLTSCDNNDNIPDADEAKEKTFSVIVEQYVNHTVIATYKSLADESIELYNALVALKQNKTNANVQTAAEKWIKARDYWELSEAFLYGAASDFGIDPHIDTWPLAKDELLAELSNNEHIVKMSGENGDEWAGSFLGSALLGFHGIEYILFENGQPKDAGKITDKELIYAVAVGGDLRNQCFRLEASWASLDQVTNEKKQKLESLEMRVTVNGGKYSYGQDMLNAGKAGSTKTSFAEACETIIEGCITIADEVGAMKIGMPYTGEDVNYIESPYSYNSKVDFIGNIKSIQNAYLGGADAGKRGASLSDFIKTVDSGLDTQIKDAIINAIAKIDAIPYPFDKNFTSVQAGEAMEACNDLSDILSEAKKALYK